MKKVINIHLININSIMYIIKEELNDKGQVRYRKYSTGYWFKIEYDNNGNITYYENSTGYWSKTEYDNNGNVIYYENISVGKITYF